MADSLKSTSQQDLNNHYNYSSLSLVNQSYIRPINSTHNSLWDKFSRDKLTDGFALRLLTVTLVGLIILFIVFALGWIGRRKMQNRNQIYYYSIQGAQLMQTFSSQ